MKIENKAQDAVQQEMSKNRQFLSEQFLAKQMQKNENGDVIKGYRAILQTDKFCNMTNKPFLLRQKPVERHEFELVRFGTGQIIGEVQQVISKAIIKNDQLNTIINQCKVAFKGIEPIKMKCVSNGGQLLRISTYEFFKKLMSNHNISQRITDNTTNKVMDFILKSASRYQSIKTFNLPLEQ
jgi:hypothetical protein